MTIPVFKRFSLRIQNIDGVLTDLKAIGEIVKQYDAVLVTDAVSGLGAHELRYG